MFVFSLLSFESKRQKKKRWVSREVANVWEAFGRETMIKIKHIMNEVIYIQKDKHSVYSLISGY